MTGQPPEARARALLDDLRQMLNADGYDLEVSGTPGRIVLEVVAGPEACADCLVPRDLMADMASTMLAEGDLAVSPADISIRYPGDGAGGTGGAGGDRSSR